MVLWIMVGQISLVSLVVAHFYEPQRNREKDLAVDGLEVDNFEPADEIDLSIDKREPYGFGIGKMKPYGFGIGKIEPYGFGIGKRKPDRLGIGKREPYSFGIG